MVKNVEEKIYDLCKHPSDADSLVSLRDHHSRHGIKVTATNGVFDILTIPHVNYLIEASKLGDVLWVGINNDDGVTELKGEGRPIHFSFDRAKVLASLEFVDKVVIFRGKTACQFLDIVSPSYWTKGGDYDLSKVNSDEYKILEYYNTEIKFMSFYPGHSTSQLAEKIKKL